MNDAVILYSKYRELKQRQPYHINLIDELHANENAHTRILVKLLQYQKLGGSFILDSFLGLIKQMMNSEKEKNKLSFLVCRNDPAVPPQIISGENYIDALIIYSDFAIIIENKIHWAVDQYKQIQRYVENVKQKIDAENIFVIYLTANENKKASERSFTIEAQEALEYKNEEDSGRFIQLTYMSHILPWLENEVLPSCTIKEEWLISALRQYIDHLKGMFGLRDYDKIIWDKIRGSVSAAAIRDFPVLQPDTPEYRFMNTLTIHLRNDMEKTFCDKILNHYLAQIDMTNPGSWYPDFGNKWGTIICPRDNLVGRDIGTEKFYIGFPATPDEFSREWSAIYWQNICEKFPAVHRNQWYWLGYCKLPDCDFSSTSILEKVIEECGTNWEQSQKLNEKAKNIVKYIESFYHAVQEAYRKANSLKEV
ncbi:MAG: PD-(D/E)XK nuclease family protein [Victivallaceae bacterium]|nr:PD-(D/E)XK nuclease family protein [Victivallaceae bacterium]